MFPAPLHLPASHIIFANHYVIVDASSGTMLKPSTSLILTCMLCFQVCGLDAELDESEITLVSPDGCKFVVKKRVAKQSVVLQTIMEGGL